LQDSLTRPAELAYAISLMKTDQTAEAQNVLKPLEKAPSYRNATLWYNALIQLKAGNIDSCKNLLDQIKESSSYFGEAKKLRAELKK